ncbi:uncharacterized protein [Eleutherodactylus coqui]|uniref:uncharacterized protein n=1 Tax=Eleutherodactylus coqui TaxID=57060 RepID=UPI003462F538
MSQTKNNYSSNYLFPVKQITYPTPPYMSIRRDETKVFRPTVTRRKLMDMIKKFDSKDISYIDWTFDKEASFFIPQVTSIQDSVNKYFIVNSGTVWARPLQGANIQVKATFDIAFHFIRDLREPVITLQVHDQDQYVSYEPNGDKRLKVLPLGQRNLQDAREFFFYLRRVTNSTYAFEPVQQPGGLISTSQDSNSPVTVQPASANTHYTNFAFDTAFNVSSFMRPETEQTSNLNEERYGEERCGTSLP